MSGRLSTASDVGGSRTRDPEGKKNQRPRVIQSTSNPQSGNRTNRWGQWPQQESNLLGFTPMNDAKPLEPDLNGFTANITATGNVKT